VATMMSAEEEETREGRKIVERCEQTSEWLKPLQRLLRNSMLKKDVLNRHANIFATLGRKD